MHCETVSATVEALQTTKIPVFYYHFAAVYNDDFPLLEMLSMLSKTCPNLVGAKISGVSDLDVIRAVAAAGYGILGTGTPALTLRPRGWICYPWEAPAGREFIASGASVANESESALSTMRREIGAQRVPSRKGACVTLYLL